MKKLINTKITDANINLDKQQYIEKLDELVNDLAYDMQVKVGATTGDTLPDQELDLTEYKEKIIDILIKIAYQNVKDNINDANDKLFAYRLRSDMTLDSIWFIGNTKEDIIKNEAKITKFLDDYTSKTQDELPDDIVGYFNDFAKSLNLIYIWDGENIDEFDFKDNNYYYNDKLIEIVYFDHYRF